MYDARTRQDYSEARSHTLNCGIFTLFRSHDIARYMHSNGTVAPPPQTPSGNEHVTREDARALWRTWTDRAGATTTTHNSKNTAPPDTRRTCRSVYTSRRGAAGCCTSGGHARRGQPPFAGRSNAVRRRRRRRRLRRPRLRPSPASDKCR